MFREALRQDRQDRSPRLLSECEVSLTRVLSASLQQRPGRDLEGQPKSLEAGSWRCLMNVASDGPTSSWGVPRGVLSPEAGPEGHSSCSELTPVASQGVTQAPATTMHGTDVRLGAPDGGQPCWVARTLSTDPLARPRGQRRPAVPF